MVGYPTTLSPTSNVGEIIAPIVLAASSREKKALEGTSSRGECSEKSSAEMGILEFPTWIFSFDNRLQWGVTPIRDVQVLLHAGTPLKRLLVFRNRFFYCVFWLQVGSASSSHPHQRPSFICSLVATLSSFLCFPLFSWGGSLASSVA